PRPTRRVHLGQVWDDPYDWLRDEADPAVDAHLAAENAWTDASLAHLAPLRERLAAELSRIYPEEDHSPEVPDGEWAYGSRRRPGRQHREHYRRRTADGAVQVVLDEDQLAVGQAYLRIGEVVHSDDHRYVAYSVDRTGGERFEIRILDLETGETLPDRIVDAHPEVVWAADGATLLWIALDPTQRPHRVHRHRVGDPGPDPVVYQESDPEFWVHCTRTSSRRFVVVLCGHTDRTEHHLLPADDPAAPLRCVQRRKAGERWALTHVGDWLWWRTNVGLGSDPLQNCRLMRAPVASPQSLEEVIPHDPAVALEDVHAQQDVLILTEREAGQLRIRVRDLASGASHPVAFPEELYLAQVDQNLEHDAPYVRLSYGSMVTPTTVFRYHHRERRLEIEHQQRILDHDPAAYRTYRRWVTGPTGVRVPVSLAHRTDVEPGPQTPLAVFAYGAYGSTVDPQIMPPWLTVLRRGGVLAIAHVRGGGMLGRAWYEAGRGKRKQASIDDHLAAVRGLHALGIGSPATTLLHGSSAGGVLIGAAANQAPEVCAAIWALAPFVTVVDAMLDPSLPLTTFEYEQWGDPREPDEFDSMRAWSPYENVGAHRYPNVFAVAGRADPRVPFWGPAKWIARLRERATSGAFLLRTRDGGHVGVSGRAAATAEAALQFAWVLDQLGLADA
ncbi:MAG: prolyl oligopeptidase family serine peptidase, partial [Myxococcota bacterium]